MSEQWICQVGKEAEDVGNMPQWASLLEYCRRNLIRYSEGMFLRKAKSFCVTTGDGLILSHSDGNGNLVQQTCAHQ